MQGDYTLQKDELRYINEEILLKDERLAYFGQKEYAEIFPHMEQFDHAVNEDFKETKNHPIVLIIRIEIH